MADLTSLYHNKPKRDQSIQACADCLNKVALLFPNEFKKGKFTDYFDISGGTQPPKSNFIHTPKSGYVRFLQIRDFASENTPTYIPIASKNKLCSNDDLVLGRYGASVGKILTGKEGAYNVACARIIFLNDNEIDKDFLFYWLHSSYFQTSLTSITRSAQGGFNKNDLRRVETFFPTLQVQKKFAAILRMIDSALLSDTKIDFIGIGKSEIEYSFIALVNKFLSFINETEELSTEFKYQEYFLKQLYQSFLSEAMQGKLTKQDKKEGNGTDLLKRIKAEKEKLIAEKKLKKEKELSPIKEEEIPFAIPESWLWCRLGEICVKIGSGSTPKGSNYSKSGFPFFRSQNIYSDGLVYDDITFVSDEVQSQMKGTRVIANDILLNITGGSLGRCALVPSDFKEGNVSQHVCIIRPVFIDNKFLHNIVLSPFFQKYIFSSTTGAGREGLPKYNLEQFPIPLPPLAEQKRIVKKLEEVMNLCDELKTTITDNQNYTDQLLQVALRDALQMKEVEVTT